MSIADHWQSFCVLECSGCQQRKRTQHRRQFECTRCQKHTTLVPRCIFEMALTDESGSATAVISGNLAEQLLSATTDTIFQKTCIKHEQLCPNMPTKCCATEFFYIQVRRGTSKGSTGGQRTVRILWYIEKECFFPIIGGSSHSRAGQPAGAPDRDANERKGEGETSGSSVSVDAGVEMQ